MKKISDLTELEKAWLWQGHIMLEIFRERGIDKIEFIDNLSIGDKRVRGTIFNTYQRYFKSLSSGRAEIPVLIKFLNITEEPQKFGIVYGHIRGGGVRHSLKTASIPVDKTCQHCGEVYEQADIDHENYFSHQRLCPHCHAVVGEWGRVASLESTLN